jgi:Uma2 family endonuclease
MVAEGRDMAEHAIGRMTEAEFLEWQLTQSARYELVDGQPHAMTGARFGHDRVLGNAFALIRRALRDAGSPCDAFTADIAVRVPPGNLRRPDVAVYCPPWDEDAMVSDRPRFVIEVLSETTETTDQTLKLEEYKLIGALDHIILVAPRVVDAVVWSRHDDGSWGFRHFDDLDDVIELPRLGISFSIAELYERVELRRGRPRLVRNGE